MSIDVAIVADDLTGALDTSVPFALAGLRVAVATRPEGLRDAIDSGADIVAVSTASRALPPGEAAQRVAEVSALLQAERPRVALKKIDSRLQGNPGPEAHAMAGALGFDRLLVAPAVPDQGRTTVGGAVTGRGVAVPVPVAPHFLAGGRTVRVADSASDRDLDRIVAETDWSDTLAVGARGLGAAFARRHGTSGPVAFVPRAETLFAIGSRDPITEAQVDAIESIDIHDAPLGELSGNVSRLPAVIRCTGEFQGPDEAISLRFAGAVAGAVEALGPQVLVMSGGDTALAILDRMGIGLVFPQGEAGPGLPLFLIERESRPNIWAVVKSGGFGNSDALAALLPPPQRI